MYCYFIFFSEILGTLIWRKYIFIEERTRIIVPRGIKLELSPPPSPQLCLCWRSAPFSRQRVLLNCGRGCSFPARVAPPPFSCTPTPRFVCTLSTVCRFWSAATTWNGRPTCFSCQRLDAVSTAAGTRGSWSSCKSCWRRKTVALFFFTFNVSFFSFFSLFYVSVNM